MDYEHKYFSSQYTFADLRSARKFLRSEAFEALVTTHDFSRIEIKLLPKVCTIKINS